MLTYTDMPKVKETFGKITKDFLGRNGSGEKFPLDMLALLFATLPSGLAFAKEKWRR